MPIKVDQCKHFNGLNCPKCGRMLPDVCKDNADIEDKAAAFDRLVASGEIEIAPVEEVVEEAPAEAVDEPEEAPATTPAPAPQKPTSGPRKGRKDGSR